MTRFVTWPRIAIAGAVVLALCITLGLTRPWERPQQGPAAPTGTASAAPADITCEDGAQRLDQVLSSGATWSLCSSIDPDLGLVLSNIHITPPGAEPISLIDTLSISQLEVPYDDGGRNTYDITEAGFGGIKMKTLGADVCPGDRLSFDIPNIGDGTYGKTERREVLCSSVVDGGVAYHSSDRVAPAAARRTDLQLFTVSRVGWYEYLTEYTFGADGSIDVQLGATGDLSPVDYSDADHGSDIGQDEHATSHSHNAVWRVDWALGGPSGMQVEQYDAEPTGEMGENAPIIAGSLTRLEHPTTADWQERRWWRVLNPEVLNEDGRPISYEIDLAGTDSFTFVDEQTQDGAHVHDAGAGYDVAFTNADDCQIYAVKNDGPCGDGVPDFVADGQGEPLDDVVSWVAVGFHHVPRDEDQSPMEMHWQGFGLVPRGLTAQRFDLPEGHEEVNGVPDSEWHEEPT
ncbi:copper amine oxidase [Brachybacterium phenoliresistens]|uniref:copper amine oxidase n=1 Tax=Brachybacterium phenoliresistens TaxID=396014 RepID=UPI0031D57AE5